MVDMELLKLKNKIVCIDSKPYLSVVILIMIYKAMNFFRFMVLLFLIDNINKIWYNNKDRGR